MLKTFGTGLVLLVCLTASAAAQTTSAPCHRDAATAHLAQRLFSIINAARAAHGAAPLRWSDTAADAAQCHSREMASAHRLSHGSEAGLNPGERLHQAGLDWSRVAENVAEAPSIESAEQMMMNEPAGEPNHRANILDPHLTRLGIGIVRHGIELFITEDFYTPLHG